MTDSTVLAVQRLVTDLTMRAVWPKGTTHLRLVGYFNKSPERR